MLLVYCQHITNRISYVFDLLLKEICGIDFKLTTDEQSYKQHDGPSLNYSDSSLKPNELQYRPSSLLFETNIVPQDIIVEQAHGFSTIRFLNNKEEWFDPFAAAFYLVSRYEEYLPYTPDKFGRFEASSSFLHKHKLIEQPLVNIWSEDVKRKLLQFYPNISTEDRSFSGLVTIDVDQAYAYKHRGVLKNILSFGKNLFHLNIEAIVLQANSLIGRIKDPFDGFYYLKRAQEQSGIPFTYFINVGDYSRFDKNLPTSNKHFKHLLQQIASIAEIGLHPSYYSNEQPQKFKLEKQRLEKCVEKEIKKSRQHYLKLRFPQTYQQLLAAGFKEDYSMGFASYPGFRAGICVPFYWFDLSTNEATTLRIFAVTVMEGTFIDDLFLNATEASAVVNRLFETVKSHNGLFVCIWHNHTLSNLEKWNSWKEMFELYLTKMMNAKQNRAK
jgi:hypothetical protein